MKDSITYAYPQNKLSSSYENFDCFDKLTVRQINLFLRAVQLVKKKYYLYEFDHTNNELPHLDLPNEAIEQTERVFAYELYHQWSMCLGKKWLLNGEISKHLSWFYNNKEIGITENQKYPDLVLHKGPADNKQLIVCEIKRKNHLDRLQFDLQKLAVFTSSSGSSNIKRNFMPFKCGVILLINGSVNDLENKIGILFQQNVFSQLFVNIEDTKK